jgi:uncharacterized protein (DUF111 family)
MRIAYVHGYDGVSGPLLLGALLDVGASLVAVQEGWRLLQLPEVQVSLQRVPGADAVASHLVCTTSHVKAFLAQHSYTTLRTLVEGSAVAPGVKQGVLRLLTHFAAAVARVHGVQDGEELAVRSVYMPEVLALGSGVVLALAELAVAQVVAGPMPLGSGCLEDMGQSVPLPRPLTAELSRGVLVCGHRLPGELTTVAGAAILTGLTTSFGPLPGMTIAGTGYGATTASPTEPGRRLQVLLGDVEGHAEAERIAVIEANIDDMNPEFYECVFERLFAHGALDVTLTPLFMKKNRPANTLTVLAPLPTVPRLSRLILQETSTFGVRVYEVWRQKLERFHRPVDTCYGVIPVKCGVLDGRIIQAAPEYEACKRAAQEHGVPVRLIYAEAARLAAPWLP